MKLKEVIKEKRRPVISVHEDASVQTVACIMDRHEIGAVVVLDPAGHVVGLMTEREVVRAISHDGYQALPRPIAAYLKKHVCICSSDDQIKHAASRMIKHRTSYIPVVEDGDLRGIVSSGDVLKWRLAEVEEEAHVLREIALTAH